MKVLCQESFISKYWLSYEKEIVEVGAEQKVHAAIQTKEFCKNFIRNNGEKHSWRTVDVSALADYNHVDS